MRRFGTVTLILFAFVVGFVSTYSCGGGSSAAAGGNADTLEGLPASAFALSTHSHPGYATTALLSSHTHSEYADSHHQHDGPDILDGSIVNIINFGSAAYAGTADTLDGMDSSDFAGLDHGHSSSDIAGTIDAQTLGSYDATTLDEIVQTLCMLNRGDIPFLPSNLQALCRQTAFVTSTTYSGNLGGVSGADSICQGRANTAGLTGNYMAWLSQDGNTPLNTFFQAPYTYALVDRTIISNNWDDLSGSPPIPILNLDEFGNVVTGGVWTNTDINGDINNTSDDCNNWTNGTGAYSGGYGVIGDTDSSWTTFGTVTSDNLMHLYCFQQ
jgi:hypothetical protein